MFINRHSYLLNGPLIFEGNVVIRNNQRVPNCRVLEYYLAQVLYSNTDCLQTRCDVPGLHLHFEPETWFESNVGFRRHMGPFVDVSGWRFHHASAAHGHTGHKITDLRSQASRLPVAWGRPRSRRTPARDRCAAATAAAIRGERGGSAHGEERGHGDSEGELEARRRIVLQVADEDRDGPTGKLNGRYSFGV